MDNNEYIKKIFNGSCETLKRKLKSASTKHKPTQQRGKKDNEKEQLKNLSGVSYILLKVQQASKNSPNGTLNPHYIDQAICLCSLLNKFH